MNNQNQLEPENLALKKINDRIWWVVFTLWGVALFATAGSLYFSEVRKFIPCVLCWYQRISMYPLVVIFMVALYNYDRSVIKFSLPLVVVGWLISIYHNLLVWGVVVQEIVPCQEGLSCKTTYINWLGFINIPLLSLTAFTLILVFLGILYSLEKTKLKLLTSPDNPQ